MATVKTIEIQAVTDGAEKDLKNLAKGLQKVDDGLQGVEKGAKDTEKGFKGIGTAFKAAGVGLIIAAFAKLKEVFEQNQKVADAFNTGFEALSLAFNDFFNFLDRNIGTVTGYLNNIFSDPVQAIADFRKAFVQGFVNRIREGVEALGLFGSAAVKFFSGDFAGAAMTAKEAGKQLVDVVTGVDDSFDKTVETVTNVAKGIANYTRETVKAAKNNVELQKTAELAIAQNRIILEQKDREAEKLRQIRDDENVTIEERIAANEKLAEVLNEQERLMLANADALVAAAQAQYDKNANVENELALLEAKAEREGILAQVEGFRSEQLMNRVSLERELKDLELEAEEKALERKQAIADAEQDIIKQVSDARKDATDELIGLFGAETAVGKAALLAKQAIAAQELIMEVSKTITFSSQAAARSTVAVAEGTAQTAKVGFPQNIPLLIGYAAQAAGIIMAIKGAVSSAKSAGTGIGGMGGGLSAATPQEPAIPAAPDFNVVGTGGANQIAEALGQQNSAPIKAFVVSDEVTTAQSLDRNIINSASLG